MATQPNAVEIDGIKFQILLAKGEFTVPRCKFLGSRKPVGIRIINNTPKPFYFNIHGNPTPEITTMDGEIIFGGYWSDWVRECYTYDFCLANPGGAITFFPKCSLWQEEDNQFTFIMQQGYETGSYWMFKLNALDIYRIRFVYANSLNKIRAYDLKTQKSKQIENLWTGVASTPFVELRIEQANTNSIF
jgi:hypothetical protein